MTWLKSIGTVVLKIIGIATGFLPLIESVVPQTPGVIVAENWITKIFNIIITAEQMFAPVSTTSGVQMGTAKLSAATPYVAALIQQSLPLPLRGKIPNNQQLYQDAVTRLTSASADILNSFAK